MMTRFFFTWILLACSLQAQNALHIRDWKQPAGEAPARPQSPCSGLRALTGYEFTVITAVLHPASGEVPEFCRAIGQIQPEIRFEVSFPTAWNKRLYMFGNGGQAGENLEAPARIAHRDAALKLGFAVAQTNTGHDAGQEPGWTFAVNSQKLLDYAFRAVHVTAETAKRLSAAYYGSEPARSYFNGCSTGGRQALMSAQRFPRDFDGIIAGAPVLNMTGIRLQTVAMARALEAAPISMAKLKLLADRIYARCDIKDGLEDGLIDDPRRCDFQPSQHLPKCGDGDGPGCFTEGEIRSLETIYGDIKVKGKRVFPGRPLGAEIAEPNGRSGWDGWIVQDGVTPISVQSAEGFFRYAAYPKKDPNYQLKDFDFDRDPPRLEWIGQVLDATQTDLTSFRQRGGKLLMWFGWADPALTPFMGVEYYEAVLHQMGPAARDFLRLYMLPGVFHCSGGVGCASFDPLAPLIDWVEQGKAPDSLLAARIDGDKVVRTRPLCPYPRVAKYKGSGSIDDARNFVCADPS
jgi:Tannase and feruloyl esterase